MKRNVSLYIAGTKVDLDDNSLILFNYAMTDLTNPTIVKNSYSHQVKLRGTKTNNKLFGEIFKLDRQTIYSEDFTGAHFDPMRKTPFEIYDDTSTCLESGYVKLNSISRNGADVSYNVTLYGKLGSFLYGLSYNSDGSRKTLADIKFYDKKGKQVSFELPNCKQNGDLFLDEAWLSVGTTKDSSLISWWHIINFIPAYNGIPKDFDAQKFIHSYDTYYNSPIPGDGYGSMIEDSTCVMSQMANSHTEQEMREYRWYLQRPGISVKAMIKAICDPVGNGGYTVNLDESFFNDNNPYWANTWMTLRQIPSEYRNSDDCIRQVLKISSSPAEYLLSFVKLFGLVLTIDSRGRVYIKRRATFFSENKESVIDLTSRVNAQQGITILPIVANSRRYQLGTAPEGLYAKEYQNQYNVPYGVQRIDTGYEFNNETTDLTNDVVFKIGVEVLERNQLYQSSYYKTNYKSIFIPALFEDVETEVWLNGEGKTIPMQRTLATNSSSLVDVTYFNNDPLSDFFPKLQLYSENRTPIDGDNILVFFNGWVTNKMLGRISKWTEQQEILNEGVPCWDLYNKGIAINYLPHFSTFKIPQGHIVHSLLWGNPREVSFPFDGEIYDSIYQSWWQGYISDLYDDDTKIMRCKVNLRGLPQGQSLLKRFFWYDGAMWVLNKISNFSLTTYDDVDCEFVRVNDVENYTERQQNYI